MAQPQPHQGVVGSPPPCNQIDWLDNNVTSNSPTNNSNNISSNLSNPMNSFANMRGFKMAFLNVASLPKNFDEINFSMSSKLLDVMAFCETRLDQSFTDGSININGYDIIRKDRSRNGGGVCLYLRSSINYHVRNDIPAELEAVCVEICKPHSQPFLILAIYRPPNSSVDFFSHLENLLQTIDDEKKEIYILGDLNCNDLNNTPNQPT